MHAMTAMHVGNVYPSYIIDWEESLCVCLYVCVCVLATIGR